MRKDGEIMTHHIPEQIPTEDQMQELADFYTVFSDATRIKLLYQLLDGEKRVGDIAEAVGISQSATSHQLRFLKEKGVVGNRRAGQSIFYRLIFRGIVRRSCQQELFIFQLKRREHCLSLLKLRAFARADRE